MGYDITNKVILVTGANRGIGKVILESFIEHGAAKAYQSFSENVIESDIL